MKESMKLLEQIIEAAELADSAKFGNACALFKVQQREAEMEKRAQEGLSIEDKKMGVSWMVFHLKMLKELIDKEEGNES